PRRSPRCPSSLPCSDASRWCRRSRTSLRCRSSPRSCSPARPRLRWELCGSTSRVSRRSRRGRSRSRFAWWSRPPLPCLSRPSPSPMVPSPGSGTQPSPVPCCVWGHVLLLPRAPKVASSGRASADHADGLIGVLERYGVGLPLEPAGLNPGPVATAWAERIARAHAERRVVSVGARVRVGDATVTILAPDGDPRVDVPSLVLRLERGSFSMLFMGDATEQAQADLLLRSGSLPTRVYVPPHHGAATPYASALVQAVHPSAAVISVGAQNRYGHPTPETLAALGRVTTYRTDRDGTVELDLDGTSLVVRTHANGLPPPRGGFLPHAPPAG